MAKKREIQEYTIDTAAQKMLIRAEELGIGTAFSRADNMAPCNIGGAGMCCKQCGMGPCRLTKNGDVGVCGATIETIQARNLTRAIAAGSAAHSDHGRDMAFTLKAVANGQTEGYYLKDIAKLRRVASYYDIPIEKRAPEEIANDLADLYISQFGQQRGEVVPVRRAPKKRQERWKTLGVPGEQEIWRGSGPAWGTGLAGGASRRSGSRALDSRERPEGECEEERRQA